MTKTERIAATLMAIIIFLLVVAFGGFLLYSLNKKTNEPTSSDNTIDIQSTPSPNTELNREEIVLSERFRTLRSTSEEFVTEFYSISALESVQNRADRLAPYTTNELLDELLKVESASSGSNADKAFDEQGMSRRVDKIEFIPTEAFDEFTATTLFFVTVSTMDKSGDVINTYTTPDTFVIDWHYQDDRWTVVGLPQLVPRPG